MGKREVKSSKTARKKLLESGLKFDSSKVSRLSSDYTLMIENSKKESSENKKQKLSVKKMKDKNISEAEVGNIDQLGSHDKSGSKKRKSEKLIEGKEDKAKSKLLRKNKLKHKVSGADVTGVDQLDAECEAKNSVEGNKEKKKRKLSQRKREKRKVSIDGIDQFDAEGEDGSEKPECRSSAMESSQSETSRTNKSTRLQKADISLDKRSNKSKKSNKKKKEDKILSGKGSEVIIEETKSGASEVYHISSVDVDSSKGMKKWINEYHQQRPGLKMLQQRIDEFITSHEENEEQARKDKEALAAEGGWTVVVHQKGRKKTTDAESGTVVGSVAPAAVVGHRSQKKINDFGVDFYRFQKREAQRNEIMVLQSKFEEDKKRIQQLRSARKFRPY